VKFAPKRSAQNGQRKKGPHQNGPRQSGRAKRRIATKIKKFQHPIRELYYHSNDCRLYSEVTLYCEKCWIVIVGVPLALSTSLMYLQLRNNLKKLESMNNNLFSTDYLFW